MEQETTKILNMFLYFLAIIILFSGIRSITPGIQNFFVAQTGLMSFIVAYPLLLIAALGFVLALLQTLFYKFGMSKEIIAEVKKAKEESKQLQKELMNSKNDPAKMAKLQKEIMAKSMQTTSASFKGMFSIKSILFSYLPSIIILFIIIGPAYMAANVGYMIPITLPLLGKMGGWLFSVFVFTMIFSLILKKVLKTDM